MKTVRFAIIGCGKIGSRHAQKLQTVEDARLVGACDIKEDRAENLGKTHNCRYYANIESLLKETDADYINICTPSGLHAEHAIKALNAKKNVICEKPMALTEKDAQAMVATAKKNSQRLFIVKQNRYNPPIRLVVDLARKGILGKPLMCVVNMYWNRDNAYYASESWRGTLALERSTIMSQASHFADLLLYFMGEPKKIFSFMANKTHNIEIDDTGIVAAEFKNGAFGSLNYTTCAAKKNAEGSIALFYEKGTIKIGGEHLNTIEYWNVADMDSYKLDGKPTEANDYGTYRGSASSHEHIFNAIVQKENGNENDDTERLVSGEEGIALVRFMEKAVEAARSGAVVNL